MPDPDTILGVLLPRTVSLRLYQTFLDAVLSEQVARMTAMHLANENAGEMIQEWIVAMDSGLKVGELSNMMHVYPTYSMANMQASIDIRMERLMSGMSGRVVHGLARLMR